MFKFRTSFTSPNMPDNSVKKEIQTKPIFKEGYVFQVKKFDFNAPDVRNMVADTVKEQEVIIERKMIDLETLSKVYTL